MIAAGADAPPAFEERLERYLEERLEEERAVRVGEKEVSELAAVVARHAGLFTRAQLGTLREAEAAAGEDERERLYRLRLACEEGIADAELAAREDELENALLAARIEWRGEELPLRSAQARLAVLPGYRDRHELGERHLDSSASFNERRRSLLAARERLQAELSGEPDPIARSEARKQVSLTALLAAVEAASAASTGAYERLRERWFERLLGPERDPAPTSAHAGWLRRLSPLAETYPKERSVPVCLASLRRLGLDLERVPGIRLDLEDRPQKAPRACVIPSRPPAVVHLITRAQGGLHDYEAFLHEAGHALHYAGCDPGLPFAFRGLDRDYALTEVYSYIVEKLVREPGWHAEHFGLTDEEAERNAEAERFLETFLFRRYTAKLGHELDFWRRFAADGGTPGSYEERLSGATGLRYSARSFLADMDPGFYSADYLRAWIRSAQLRERLRQEVGAGWWRSRETGELLRSLFLEGTRPASEELAARIGFDPLDTEPLLEELGLPARASGPGA
jgi:hypothetical protein